MPVTISCSNQSLAILSFIATFVQAENCSEYCSVLFIYFPKVNSCNLIIGFSRADMCFNCSLSFKSMKFGMMIVFKALKKIRYGAIAKKAVKCEK